MRFLVVSGRSGSGKTTALHLLEDEGFTCIDNIPVTLVPALIEHVSKQDNEKFAVGIDARNTDSNLGLVGEILDKSKISKEDYRIVFLDTQTDVLFKRFSETRRKHPLSDEHTDLSEALEKERGILSPIVNISDITIDTSGLNLHELRSTIRRMVLGDETKGIAVMFTSFGFKYGSPTDADFIFDVRSLPNPYWEPSLRIKTGLDEEVRHYLSEQKEVKEMIKDIASFVKKWIPSFQANNRSYLTIGIGCTGGMHRSVYISECLSEELKMQYKNVLVRHRHIDNKKTI